MTSITRADRRARFAVTGVASLLVVVAAVATATCSREMPAMHGMAMPGGATRSMTWMPMPGRSWLGAIASFVSMWTAMMVPMMLPSVAPSLLVYRQRLAARGAARAGTRSALAAVGYFTMWAALGIGLFPLGAAAAGWLVRAPSVARLVPAAIAFTVIGGGAVQFTEWKRGRLAACERSLACDPLPRVGLAASWRLGLQLGFDCCASCANWMAILLAIGVMEPAAMVAITAAISAERLAPPDSPIRFVTGSLSIVAGLVLSVR